MSAERAWHNVQESMSSGGFACFHRAKPVSETKRSGDERALRSRRNPGASAGGVMSAKSSAHGTINANRGCQNIYMDDRVIVCRKNYQ